MNIGMFWVSLARAADLDVGGGVDAIAGVVHPPAGEWAGAAGIRQLEGDLRVREGAVTFELALDASATVDFPFPAVFAIVPEEATVLVNAGKVWVEGGIAPAPWRLERVDGWDNALVTWSLEDRTWLPGSLLGATVGVGTPEAGVGFSGGVTMKPGLDLLGEVGPTITGAPIVVGVHGAATADPVRFSGGVFAFPDSPAVSAQAAADIDLDPVRLQVQAVGGWNAPFGGHVEAAFFAKDLVSPVLRAEYLAGSVGATAGVAVRPKPFFVAKAELGWVAGVPQAWVEAAVYRPWPPTKRRAKRK